MSFVFENLGLVLLLFSNGIGKVRDDHPLPALLFPDAVVVATLNNLRGCILAGYAIGSVGIAEVTRT